jgi:hypothetical protein
MDYHVSRFGGGAQDSNLLPLTLILMVLALGWILLGPKKMILVPVLVASLIIPLGQVLLVGPLHFQTSRILLLAGWVRVLPDLFSGKIKINATDMAVAFWAISNVVCFSVLYGNTDAIVNRMGFLYTTIGTYALMRVLISDVNDIKLAIRCLAGVCVIVSIFMLGEQISGRNAFAMFGSVSEFTVIRNGKLRSQGPFLHALLAGTFAAVIVPLFAGLWTQGGRDRLTAAAGIVGATTMVVTCASSTPLAAYGAGLVALGLWPIRNRLSLLRWGAVFTAIGLHMVMKAPVWALIGRLDFTGSSSGYHRYMLVDQTIRRFGEWWLCGTKDTASWGWDLGDTSNQFVEQAVTGGILTLMAFFLIFGKAFQGLGIARRRCEGGKKGEWLIWSLGACLAANVVAFIGISYFDQTQTMFMTVLASISAATGLEGVRKEGSASPQTQWATAKWGFVE